MRAGVFSLVCALSGNSAEAGDITASQGTGSVKTGMGARPPAGRSRTALIAVIVVVLIVIAGVGFYYITHKPSVTSTSVSVSPYSDYSYAVQGTAIQFSAGTTVPSSKVSYVQWNFGNGVLMNISGSSGLSILYTYPSAGNYLVYVKVVTDSGMVATNSLDLLPISISPSVTLSNLSEQYPADIEISYSNANAVNVSYGFSSITPVPGVFNLTTFLPSSFSSYPVASGWSLQSIIFSAAGKSVSFNSTVVSNSSDSWNITFRSTGIYPVNITAVTNSSSSTQSWHFVQTVAVGTFSTKHISGSSSTGIVDATWIPGGFRTMDTALAYDTISSEVIQNLYQTLVSFTPGTNPHSFIPVLSQEVPTLSNGLIAQSTVGNVTYVNYTFPIRQGISFANGQPLTVYDVWFSFVRTMLFANDPGSPGWLLAHALIPGASVYGPFNLTPFWIDHAITTNSTSITFHILPTTNQSLFGISPVNGTNAGYFETGVNMSSSAALSDGYAATEYTSYGSSTYFLQILTGTEASVMEASWAAANGAGIPANTTTAYYNYQSEGIPSNWNTKLQFNSMGTGPYIVSAVIPGQLVRMIPNPHYTPTIDYPNVTSLPSFITIYYYTSESSAQLAFSSGVASFAEYAYPPSATSLVFSMIQNGEVKSISEPQIATNFYNYNLQINVSGLSSSGYQYSFPSSTLHNLSDGVVVSTFFANTSVRKALTYAYNQAELISMNIADGIRFAENLTGYLPQGLGSYPSNITSLSPYYNLTLAREFWQQTPYTKLGRGSIVFPIFDPLGMPIEDELIQSYWIPAIENITNGTVKPYLADVTESNLFTYESVASGSCILPIAWDAWYADYPVSEDFAATFATPFALDMYPFGVYPGPGFNITTNPAQWKQIYQMWNWTSLALNELNSTQRALYYWHSDSIFTKLDLIVGNIQPLGVLYYRSWIKTSSLLWSMNPSTTLSYIVLFAVQKV
ncbi:MAG: PKD domain-containing protein [Thermoplasmata archaeon]|uniref:PKD domain-containing protein n=1 Tax=Candidatus Sysuiplasma superficiale TaxID=2823368 RepID=A0A8J8CEZ4_9ARCH|nr:PKD domain-containing protein [Candidatus Sysuiplasma superficiale]MBX8643692.1 PKD domain-containing protein [Candidatus Sysuiplasma superficiale]MCL4346792.1 ABC transporter substrate-binding protein [Candidatus Thermoplasmatota archaeon]